MGRVIFVTLLFLCYRSTNGKVQLEWLNDALEAEKDPLILTPYIKSGDIDLARNLSKVNPENFIGIESYSGFMTVREEYRSNLFYWFFPAKEKFEDKPWIIWLQGGPGISSLFGVFNLIGPIMIEDGKVKPREVSWVGDYSVLFVDNPVGAGFSFTGDDRGYPDNEDDVGEQLYELVQQFLELFPALRIAPLFIAGQSYAGKYVPALGVQILRRNSANINFKGISIGNGLIDPRSMMHYSTLCNMMGFVDNEDVEIIRTMENNIIKLINQKQMVNASNKFNETMEYIKKQSGVNVYNFEAEPSTKAPAFESFVQKPEVRDWIHVGNATFDFNNQLVYEKMLPDIMNTTKPFVEELLEHVGVLLYSGQLDIILPFGLLRHTVDALEWSQRALFDAAVRKRLRNQDGNVVAYKKSGGHLQEVLIRRAGHIAPADQASVTKYIINNFIKECETL